MIDDCGGYIFSFRASRTYGVQICQWLARPSSPQSALAKNRTNQVNPVLNRVVLLPDRGAREISCSDAKIEQPGLSKSLVKVVGETLDVDMSLPTSAF